MIYVMMFSPHFIAGVHCFLLYGRTDTFFLTLDITYCDASHYVDNVNRQPLSDPWNTM